MKNRFALLLCCAATASAQPRPNILFMIADDIGRELFGTYGCDYIRTPNFDKVAEKGILFTRAFTTNGKCAPSRATIISGRHFFQNGDAAIHQSTYPVELGSFQHTLENKGYAIGYTGKGWGPGSWQAGGWKENPVGPAYNTKMYAQGFHERVGFRNQALPQEAYADVSLRPVGPYTSEQMKELVFSGNVWNTDYPANFGKFLEERPKDKPFSFWLGSHDGHRPWLTGAGRRFKGNLDEVDVPPFYPDTEDMRQRRLDIGVEVELFDAHVGEAIELLKKHGVFENTLIVVTSDNGTDGRRSKGDTYMNNCNMALAIMMPSKIRPRVSHENISFSDFAPTFLELAGIECPSTVLGKSFTDVLFDAPPYAPRLPMFCGRENYSHRFIYPSRSITVGNFYYIRNYLPDARYPEGTPQPPKKGDGTTLEVPYEHSILQNIIDERDAGNPSYWNWCYEKRPAEELYDLSKDPHCLNNLER